MNSDNTQLTKLARDEALVRLREFADVVLSRVAEGYTQVNCILCHLESGIFPIRVIQRIPGGKQRQITERKYAKPFTDRGLVITLGEAVDLKIAVQSWILADPRVGPFRR